VQVKKICSIKEDIGRLAAGILATVIAGLYVSLKKRIEPLQVFSNNSSRRPSRAEDLVAAVQPGADNFIELLPVQGRKGALDLFICE
jgi:hypothetical protein